VVLEVIKMRLFVSLSYLGTYIAGLNLTNRPVKILWPTQPAVRILTILQLPSFHNDFS
jgi:hypothetical protein